MITQLDAKKSELTARDAELKEAYVATQNTIAQQQNELQNLTNELVRTQAQLQLIDELTAEQKTDASEI